MTQSCETSQKPLVALVVEAIFSGKPPNTKTTEMRCILCVRSYLLLDWWAIAWGTFPLPVGT